MTTITPSWNSDAACAPREACGRVNVVQVDGILVVTETVIGVTGTRTYVWKYDLEKKLCSTAGRIDDIPSTAMSDADVEWIRTHRLPRLDESARAAESLELQAEAA